MIATILIVWLGSGSDQTFRVIPFNSMEACESARLLLTETLKEKIGNEDLLECLPSVQDENLVQYD
jgi:hypothetical protein